MLEVEEEGGGGFGFPRVCAPLVLPMTPKEQRARRTDDVVASSWLAKEWPNVGELIPRCGSRPQAVCCTKKERKK